MKTITLAIFLALALFGCTKSSLQEAVSPDRKLLAKTKISGDEESPARRLCVSLVFKEENGKESFIQTSASDTMKWAICWSDNDTLVLYSSDVGTFAYDVSNLGVIERPANETEKKTGFEAYMKRYGSYPNT